MTCDRVAERIPDLLTQTLSPTLAEEVEGHLAGCEGCRREVEELRGLWDALKRLPAPGPGPDGRARFDAMLAAYQAGMRGADPPLSLGERFRGWLGALAPRPALQLAAAAATLTLGVVLGAGVVGLRGGGQVGELRQEVASLHRLVALSLLSQGSAGSRLEGVRFSREAGLADPAVRNALVERLQHDPNANVKLAAVEALAPAAATPEVRAALVDTLRQETSPLVQMEVVEVVLRAGLPDADTVLRQALRNPVLHEAVRARILGSLGPAT